MTQPASVGLKYGFLIVLYLFLVWVAFSALRDLRRGRADSRAAEYEPSADATGMYDAVSGPLDASGFEPRLLVIAYDLSEPVTLGRGDVEIRLEDPFASSQHVHISREGHTVVIEDLGSTNGTYLNDSPLTGPQPLHDGDRIRIGDSEFQYLQ